MTTVVQHVWENLANTLRLYVESHMGFASQYGIDRPDAIGGGHMVYLSCYAGRRPRHIGWTYNVTKNQRKPERLKPG
jgi:hypothetical protein